MGLAVALALLLAVLAVAAAIRLAPIDAARWHLPTGGLIPATAPATSGVAPMPGGAYARLSLAGSPTGVLDRLDAAALATPRTRRLAGTVAEGRITYVTRSLVWGFPDITTAEAAATSDSTTLTLVARQRFGVADGGVNAARLRGWLGKL